MALSFLGLEFETVPLDHNGRLRDFLAGHPQPLSGYSFASLAGWSSAFQYLFAFGGSDTLLVSCVVEPDPNRHLLQPIGRFPKELQETLVQRASELSYPLKIHGVSRAFLERHAELAAHFEVTETRDSANYVYTAMDLAELPGRQYAKKRNLLAQARQLYAWTLEPLEPKHLQDCLAIADDIARKRQPSTGTLEQETAALEWTLSHFGALGLRGLLLRVDGQPAAFSIYESAGPETAVVLFERALRSKKGLYQVINRETARVIASQGFTFINREEDLGDPGLRKAKLSYHPLRLEMAYTLSLRPAPRAYCAL